MGRADTATIWAPGSQSVLGHKCHVRTVFCCLNPLKLDSEALGRLQNCCSLADFRRKGLMGTWGVLLCCVNPGGDFLVIWGSWELPWEDAEPPQAHPSLCMAAGSTWTCFLAPEKCFGA